MNLETFTNMNGRIGRQTWWLGTIVMLVVGIILYFILSAVMGTGMAAMMDPQKMLEPGFMESYMRSAAWQQLVSLVLLGYPVTALMSKRLNDRDRPSWLKWLFWAPTVLSTLLGVAGMGYTMTDAGGGLMMPTPSTLMTIVTILSVIIGLWALVELGFLRGTQGDNQHGKDPVAD
jgi:uncharacterized membrane protein YhaH (DUF805 family)